MIGWPPLTKNHSERSRFPLWVWPTFASAIGLVLSIVVVRTVPGSDRAPLLGSADVEATSALLQVLATATMASLTLAFSVTVVTLQLASQQFSPRMLRKFTHDRITKLTVAVLAGTFVYALSVLGSMRNDLAMTQLVGAVGQVLGLMSVAVIVAFISHIARAIRVDTMMRSVHDETIRAMDNRFAGRDPGHPALESLSLVEEQAWTVSVDGSGFVQTVDVPRLIHHAMQHDALVRLAVRPGDQVLHGTPLASAWQTDGRHPPTEPEDVAHLVRKCVTTGYERTLDEDVSYGFRQFEDIAVKAMSPSLNDPATAAHAIGHMGALLIRLMDCQLGPTVHTDKTGTARAITLDRDLRYYLDLCCQQISRFASREPTVLLALLRALRDVGLACRTEEQRAEVRRSADLVLSEASGPSATTGNGAELDNMRHRIELVLAGDTASAYEDRAGEMRSF
jgi:uncharacterized membrane protein